MAITSAPATAMNIAGTMVVEPSSPVAGNSTNWGGADVAGATVAGVEVVDGASVLGLVLAVWPFALHSGCH